MRVISKPRLIAAFFFAVLGVLIVSKFFGILLGGFVYFWVGFIQKRRQAKKGSEREEEALEKELPELISVFEIAISAGLTVRLALEAVIEEYEILAESKRVLKDIFRSVQTGTPLADALSDAPPQLMPLIIPLVESERYGVELLPALKEAGRDARETNRRKVETEVRKAPVKLLFPLVICILPAFGLLTIVPVLIKSLERIT